ncbi:ECF-type sigma factor [Undibacterium cyanobacteriorum]|uniref:ECF-type sigma factor n=1 Tax=Undibacterium cyanobacteriorum TaxID=3073561 RepID=A0ABY9RH63_9BURK|nr:ECF-type sigma factor [Undibacterium sp. 20NA77.5]WMW80568.1 ECF-type sigma factor [Undibacterium sp. 20NA77.5]
MRTDTQPPLGTDNIDESERLPQAAELTLWLQQAGFSFEQSTANLFIRLYQELRRLAQSRLWHEAPDHTLSATALTHEAYLRLSTQQQTEWKNRSHFLAMAATMMRRILIDHALAKQADKRAAELVTLSAAELIPSEQGSILDVLDLHQALCEFEQLDPRAARIVELRFFGGLELEEIAETLDISLATIKRDWTLARAWMRARLS